MRKTKKSDTLAWLERDLAIRQLPPSSEPTLGVVDLMMLLRMVCTDTMEFKTFGELADKLITTIFGLQYRYTFVVGDNYTNVESIKSGERARRGAIQMTEIRYIAPVTPLPIQRTKMLSNPKPT